LSRHQKIETIRLGQPAGNHVNLIADLLVALEPDHVNKAAAFRHLDDRIGLAGVLVRDLLHEQQREDVVLVLRGVHAAAQFVAATPKRAIELGLLQGHGVFFLCLALVYLCV